MKWPKNPLNARKVITELGLTPPGSSGWGYGFDKDPMTICDLGQVGRFWPARYNEKQDAWAVTGDGYQMVEGEVVETFPL